MQKIPDKMKLNKYVDVRIPRTRDLYTRYGLRETVVTPSDSEMTVPLNSRKLDTIAQMDALDVYHQRQEQRRAEYDAAQQHAQDSSASAPDASA